MIKFRSIREPTVRSGSAEKGRFCRDTAGRRFGGNQNMEDMEACWNRNWRQWNDKPEPSSFARKAAEKMKETGVRRVLDLGCGRGRESLFFASLGFEVTAADISDEALKNIRHPLVRTEKVNVREKVWEPRSFDAVFANLSLHYFEQDETRRIVIGIENALTPGGLFFIRCKSTADPLYGKGEPAGEGMYRLEHIRRFWSAAELGLLLSGFENAEILETREDYYGPCAFVEGTARKKYG